MKRVTLDTEPVVCVEVQDAVTAATVASHSTRTREPSTSPGQRKARFICVAGTDLGSVFLIGPAPIVIGRSANVSLRNTDISRSHARVWAKAGEYMIEDLGSVNGTLVNNVQIHQATVLRFGDRVQVGSAILIFTHHDELEARMQQQQRLETMSALAAGLAHDFNNALMLVMCSIENLDERLERGGGGAREELDVMRQAVLSASQLGKRLLHLGRSDAIVFETISVATLVEETLGLTRHALGKGVALSINIPPTATVRGSRGELQQVLINLLVNARDAMPDGGKISINAQIITLDRMNALSRHLPAEGRYVDLSITDNGIGMDETTRAGAFDPFFTTKAPGKGTGLGLTMVHSVIRRHGGAAFIESVLDRGTTIRTLIPSGS